MRSGTNTHLTTNPIASLNKMLFMILIFSTALAGCTATITRSDYEHFILSDTENAESESYQLVEFLGNTNLVFSNGEASILVDGYFSFPAKNLLHLAVGKIESDARVVSAKIQYIEKTRKIEAIIPAHSHYDHAMDVGAAVVNTSDAIVFGSKATENILRGWLLQNPNPEIKNIDEFMNERFVRTALSPATGELGTLPCPASFLCEQKHDRFLLETTGFKVQLRSGVHWKSLLSSIEHLLQGNINQPVKTPRNALSFGAADVYNIELDFKVDDTTQYKSLVITTAGIQDVTTFEDLSDDSGEIHSLRDRVDVLFLGVSGAVKPANIAYTEKFLESTIGFLRPKVVVPIHWDSQVHAPVNGSITHQRGLFNQVAKPKYGLGIVCRYTADKRIKFVVLDYAQKVRFIDLLNAPQHTAELCPKSPGKIVNKLFFDDAVH